MKMERRTKQLVNIGACVAQRYIDNRVSFIGGLAMSGNGKNNKWFIVMAIVFVCFAFSPPQAEADWMERQKLLAGDGASADYFGYSVSINGNFAIVGAYGDDDNGSSSGSAYIFNRDGMSWSQQAKLLASDGAASGSFGRSVSISGDYTIVGASGDDSAKGSAYIFKWDGAIWSQQAKILASDGAASDGFGRSVSISGDYAIVAAAGDDDNGDASGSAYIFKRDGTNWSQQAKLLAADGNASDIFGCSVSISGDYAIVGAYLDDHIGTDFGSAYIFKRDGTSWSEQQKLTDSYGTAGDQFGYSVSISGDYAIVGAPYCPWDLDFGSVYIFRRDGTSWVQQQNLFASDDAAGDHFGYSVSISGDYAIVGAAHNDDKGDSSGSAYRFKLDGTNWSEQTKMTASDGAAGDYFGGSVSISGDLVIVGAYGDDDKGTSSGSAYIFGFCPRADLNDDCKVDFADFAIVADWWLYGTD